MCGRLLEPPNNKNVHLTIRISTQTCAKAENGMAAWYTDRPIDMPSQFQSSLKIGTHFHTEISHLHTEISLVRIDLDLTRLRMQIKISLTIAWVKKDSSNFRYEDRREIWSSVYQLRNQIRADQHANCWRHAHITVRIPKITSFSSISHCPVLVSSCNNP